MKSQKEPLCHIISIELAENMLPATKYDFVQVLDTNEISLAI